MLFQVKLLAVQDAINIELFFVEFCIRYFYVKVYLYLLFVRRAGSLGHYIHSFEPQHESSCPGIVSVSFDRTHVALFMQVKLPRAILRNLLGYVKPCHLMAALTFVCTE